MSSYKPPYRAYLLRLWATRDSGQILWRASLEDPHSSQRIGFSTLERLFAFLQDQCEPGNDGSLPPARPFSEE